MTRPTDAAPGSAAAHEDKVLISPASASSTSTKSTTSASVDPDAELIASMRRRERLLEQLDRTRELLRVANKDLARTTTNLARTQAALGYRAERAVRRGVRALLRRAPGRHGQAGNDGGAPGDRDPGRDGSADDRDRLDRRDDSAGTYRAAMRERLAGDPTAIAPRLRVAVIGRPESLPGIQSGLAAIGLDALVPGTTSRGLEDPISDAIDIVLALEPTTDMYSWPRRIVRIAWLADQPDPWLAMPHFDDLDIVLVADDATKATVEARSTNAAWVTSDPATPDGVHALRDALLRWVNARRVAIHISPPTWEAATSWGDLPFGRDLQKAFERRGWPATLHVFAERESAPAQRADLAIHILGVRAPAVRPGQVSVLWIISHPDLIRPEACLAYDVIGVGSDLFLAYLREWLGADCPPLVALHQATDPERFFPEPGGPAHDILFVGSARPVRRPFLDVLAGSAHDLAVYGRNWTPELLDPRYLRGEWIANDALHRYYSSAAVVLSDSWADMRDEGFISNRIYDALASGAFVISEAVPGLDAEFEGSVPTFRDPAELPALIDDYLAHPDRRIALAEAGRRSVLARHTFGDRVDTIIRTVEPFLADHDSAGIAGEEDRRSIPVHTVATW